MTHRTRLRPSAFGFALLTLLATPAAHAAERWWTYITGCGSADWRGTVNGNNSQGQATCWAASAGGSSGALVPTAADDVFLVQANATASLMATFSDPSRGSFTAQAHSCRCGAAASSPPA